MSAITRFEISDVAPAAPRCLDLFSGAGGLSLGFLMAGGRPIGSVDFHKDSVESFKRNFPSVLEASVVDIQDWTPDRAYNGIDVVIGGPPCQGFSLARGARFVDDPRNALYKHFVRVVGLVKPKWVVMENVEGIINIGGGIILEQVLEDFANVGFELTHRVINMAEFGVPQTRRRAIFVGSRTGAKFQWPTGEYSKQVNHAATLFSVPEARFHSVNEAIGNLALPVGNFLAHRANSQMRGPRNRDAHSQPSFTLRVRGDELALCELPATSAFIPDVSLPEPELVGPPTNSLQELFSHRPKWVSGSELKVSGKRKSSHLRGTRRLTVREQARLQTFPDWFQFEGTWASQSKQVGNAVPPLFAAHLFEAIFKSDN
jgi:DNA (cytosine-5)-methyltransferase 1